MYTKTSLFITLSISAILFVGLMFTSCKKDTSFESELFDITSLEQFETSISDGVSLIFFHATWCTKCKDQRPAVESLLIDEALSTVFIGEVDYEKVSEIVQKYQISGFPTIVIYNQGIEAARFTGQGHSSQILKTKLMELL